MSYSVVNCILLPKESRVNQQKPRIKTSQNYLKASHFGCKRVLFTLLHVSRLYKSSKKDCILAEVMVTALKITRKVEF